MPTLRERYFRFIATIYQVALGFFITGAILPASQFRHMGQVAVNRKNTASAAEYRRWLPVLEYAELLGDFSRRATKFLNGQCPHRREEK